MYMIIICDDSCKKDFTHVSLVVFIVCYSFTLLFLRLRPKWLSNIGIYQNLVCLTVKVMLIVISFQASDTNICQFFFNLTWISACSSLCNI